MTPRALSVGPIRLMACSVVRSASGTEVTVDLGTIQVVEDPEQGPGRIGERGEPDRRQVLRELDPVHRVTVVGMERIDVGDLVEATRAAIAGVASVEHHLNS